ncbi:capsid cement protein [Corynebacterium sp. NPDC060344]|uniref:capsid cement protein n=1 Tax=Corynebacterium sp. NPDC060344 TaxID=3347101 RepID=UPI003665A03E
MQYANQMRDIFNPGTDLTVVATTAVAGKTFAAISGPRSDNLLSVTTATAGAPTVGVFKYDAAADNMVGVARGSARIVTVTADGAITAGSPVEVGTGGKATTADTGAVVGWAVDTATDGGDALISLAH